MKPVIQVDNLSKIYRIGAREKGYKTFREAIIDGVTAPIRNFKRLSRLTKFETQNESNDDLIWALKDVSFEVGEGEVVGVIGRNGAGKSTLLKILSRITEPTTGDIKLYGRVSSLLEVGTGFHPELTGRENIYLNGTILGMRKSEIDRKFDEIVEFSEIEKFLDTQIKFYSSGMYVRLAFAVAAHLEPEILLVDEVLAVGDLAFQKKCLGKMQDITVAGRTVLFVSHNMQSIRSLCARGIVLDNGAIAADSDIETATSCYHELLGKFKITGTTAIHNERNRRGSGAVRFTDISVTNATDDETFSFVMKETVRFHISYRVVENVSELLVVLALRGGLDSEIITSVRHIISSNPLAAGMNGSFVIELPNIYIRPGQYPLYFWLGNSFTQPFDIIDDLTPPLSVFQGTEEESLDRVEMNPVGYFSIPSRLVLASPESL